MTVSVSNGKLDFPTRVDWDKFFSENFAMNESNAGERPDTIYIGGLPFEWFKVNNFFITLLIFFWNFERGILMYFDHN